MVVVEGRRVRHLMLRLDRGEELPDALLRALDQAEAKSGWVSGVGILEAAEIAVFDPHTRHHHRPRRIDTACELVSLQGALAAREGATAPRLSVTLARETEAGLEVLAGQLLWAKSYSVELCVTSFDDPALQRVADELTGLAVLHPAGATPPSPPRAQSPAAAAPAAEPSANLMPVRPSRPRDEPEIYPEPGDRVIHFHFGECTVIDSDGDRIRLRQDRDGRVREVALTMLRIEPPTTDPETGKRHFKLGRKN